jgi:hypothetical protein
MGHEYRIRDQGVTQGSSLTGCRITCTCTRKSAALLCQPLSRIVMPKNEDKEFHVRDLAFVIEEAVRRLPNGKSRLRLSAYPLSYACLSGFYNPDISERLSSDYGMPSGNEEVEKEYNEEIITIEKIMEEAQVPIKLAKWQSDSKIDAADRMYKSLNRRAYAIQIWDWYAIPWRFKNGFVHLIWSPHDVMGSAIIHSYPVPDFLGGMSDKLEVHFKEGDKLVRQLGFWKNLGIIVLILAGIFLWVFIQKVMGN